MFVYSIEKVRFQALLNKSFDWRKIKYWDKVAMATQEVRPQILWRAYSDAVNSVLFERWLPSEKVERLLKTDLFDESLGDGLYTLLTSRANSVVGIDISILTSRAANLRHSGLKAIEGDVRCLPFANGSFDIIVSNSTLDHFQSAEEVVDSLRELNRVLRAGGQLLITLDNLANPVIALRSVLPFRLLNRLNIVPYYVGVTFGPRRLCRHLKEVGLEVLEVSTVMHFSRILAIAMTRILERKAEQETQRRFLRFLMSFEELSHWSTRFVTGYFVAVRAIKR
jgi:SAM-dependent methyltransferase